MLYEMATGKRAFEGKSQASLITSIMGSQPAPISQVAPLAPPGLERLVQACLAKDPADRLQSARDIRMQLAWLAEGGSQTGVPAPVAAARRGRTRLAVMLAAAGWLVAIATVAWMVLRSGRQEGPFFAAIAASPSDSPGGVAGGAIAISPDGTRLATVIERSGDQMVSVYDFGSGGTSVLESTKGGSSRSGRRTAAGSASSPTASSGRWRRAAAPRSRWPTPSPGAVAPGAAPV